MLLLDDVKAFQGLINQINKQLAEHPTEAVFPGDDVVLGNLWAGFFGTAPKDFLAWCHQEHPELNLWSWHECPRTAAYFREWCDAGGRWIRKTMTEKWPDKKLRGMVKD